MRRLEGKVAVVTGGGRGIGKAVALAYAREGAAVAIVSRTRRDTEQAAAEAAMEGGSAIAVPTDVTDEAAVTRMMDDVIAAFGRCDILVTAAGVPGPVAVVAETRLAEWEEGFRGNLAGTFLCCRAVIPHMRRQGGGTILNVSSGLAVNPVVGIAVYSAAKAAVIQFSRVLAEEERPHGLRVFAAHPGIVRTALVESLHASGNPRAPSAFRDRLERLEASGVVITPEQAARLFVYLATPAADDLVGQFVRNDDPAIQSRLAAFFSA
jgi:NAD(P)-dependent dehydrogenase (short-subunit alcohol dehydrogenase family)